MYPTMPKTKDELTKKTPCSCFELPCVHNPEVSDDIATIVELRGVKTKKGMITVYLDTKKFTILEATPNTLKAQILE